jgi:hypothetical protein
MARPGRVELPTLCLEGRRSIQLSYGRVEQLDYKPFTDHYNGFDFLTQGQKLRGSLTVYTLGNLKQLKQVC